MAGQVEARDLQAEVERHRVLLLAGAPPAGAVRNAGGTSVDGTGAVDAGEALGGERAPAASASASRSWAATTFAGHRARARAVAPAHDGGRRVEHDRVGRHPVALGDARASASRRSRSRPVESIDRRQPAPQALARRSGRARSNASRLARRSRSPVPTTARRRSDETTWSGWNHVGRPVRLARRGRADEHDEARVRQAQRRPVERRLGHPAFSGPRPDRAPRDRALLAWP